MATPYRLYLDTNIFLDYIRERNEDTTKLINLAKKEDIELVTSYFTYLEILDKEAEDCYIDRELKNKKAPSGNSE